MLQTKWDVSSKNKEKDYMTQFLSENYKVFEKEYIEEMTESINIIMNSEVYENRISVFGNSSILEKTQIETLINSLHSEFQDLNLNIFFYPNKKSALKGIFKMGISHRKEILLSFFKKEPISVTEHANGVQFSICEYNLPDEKEAFVSILVFLYCTIYICKEMYFIKNTSPSTILRLQHRSILFMQRMIRKHAEQLGLLHIIEEKKLKRKENRRLV